jgi:hypothetical protein
VARRKECRWQTIWRSRVIKPLVDLDEAKLLRRRNIREEPSSNLRFFGGLTKEEITEVLERVGGNRQRD